MRPKLQFSNCQQCAQLCRGTSTSRSLVYWTCRHPQPLSEAAVSEDNTTRQVRDPADRRLVQVALHAGRHIQSPQSSPQQSVLDHTQAHAPPPSQCHTGDGPPGARVWCGDPHRDSSPALHVISAVVGSKRGDYRITELGRQTSHAGSAGYCGSAGGSRSPQGTGDKA